MIRTFCRRQARWVLLLFVMFAMGQEGASAAATYTFNVPQDARITALPFIDVRRFGARGDNSTDDTLALNTAFGSVGIGSVVEFSPATYRITGALTPPGGVTITGYGATIRQNTSKTPGFLLDGASGVSIKGFSLVGVPTRLYTATTNTYGDNADHFSAGIFTNASNETFTDNTATNFWIGIDLSDQVAAGGNVATQPSGNRTSHLHVSGCDWGMILWGQSGAVIDDLTGSYTLASGSPDPAHLLYISGSGVGMGQYHNQGIGLAHCWAKSGSGGAAYSIKNVENMNALDLKADNCPGFINWGSYVQYVNFDGLIARNDTGGSNGGLFQANATSVSHVTFSNALIEMAAGDTATAAKIFGGDPTGLRHCEFVLNRATSVSNYGVSLLGDGITFEDVTIREIGAGSGHAMEVRSTGTNAKLHGITTQGVNRVLDTVAGSSGTEIEYNPAALHYVAGTIPFDLQGTGERITMLGSLVETLATVTGAGTVHPSLGSASRHIVPLNTNASVTVGGPNSGHPEGLTLEYEIRNTGASPTNLSFDGAFYTLLHPWAQLAAGASTVVRFRWDPGVASWVEQNPFERLSLSGYDPTGRTAGTGPVATGGDTVVWSPVLTTSNLSGTATHVSKFTGPNTVGDTGLTDSAGVLTIPEYVSIQSSGSTQPPLTSSGRGATSIGLSGMAEFSSDPPAGSATRFVIVNKNANAGETRSSGVYFGSYDTSGTGGAGVSILPQYALLTDIELNGTRSFSLRDLQNNRNVAYFDPSGNAKLFGTLEIDGNSPSAPLWISASRVVSNGSAASPLTFSAGTWGIQTASGSLAGALSAADWTTFNNKLGTSNLSGTPSKLVKFTGTNTGGDSIAAESGGNLTVAGGLTTTQQVGFGGISSTSAVNVTGALISSSGTSTFGVRASPTIPATSTAAFSDFISDAPVLQANISGLVAHYRAVNANAGSFTMGQQAGYYAGNLTGAGNNATLWSDATNASGQWVILAPGGADSALAGSLSVGFIGVPGATVDVTGTLRASGNVTVSNATANRLAYFDGSKILKPVVLDSSLDLTTGTLALPGVGTAGTYAYPSSLTTDAKGRVTSITGGSTPLFSETDPNAVLLTGTQTAAGNKTWSGDMILSGNTASTLVYHNGSKALKSVTLDSSLDLTGGTLALAATGTPGTYAYPSSLTTDAKGRVTSITAGSTPLFTETDPNAVHLTGTQTAAGNKTWSGTATLNGGMVLGDKTVTITDVAFIGPAILGFNSSGASQYLTGSAYQVLRVPSGGGTPGFGAIDLSQSAGVTGLLGLANLTAGASDTVLIGPGPAFSATPTVNRLTLDGTTGGSQFKVQGTTGVISALSLTSDSGGLGFDADYDGTNWKARSTSASLIYKSSTQLDFYGNTGLTSGNSYTPSTLMSLMLGNGGLVLATGNLSFTGENVAKTITVGRRTSTAAAGRALTMAAGSPKSGETNQNAGDLAISSGTATGNGTGNVLIQAAGGGSSGTSDRSPVTVATFAGNGDFTLAGSQYAGNASSDQGYLGTNAAGKFVFKTNPLTSFTEADTLNSVTGRGSSTSNAISTGAITAAGNISPSVDITDDLGAYSTRFNDLHTKRILLGTALTGGLIQTDFIQLINGAGTEGLAMTVNSGEFTIQNNVTSGGGDFTLGSGINKLNLQNGKIKMGIAAGTAPTITTGSAVPSSSEVDGSIYLRTGTQLASLYVHQNGAWVLVK